MFLLPLYMPCFSCMLEKLSFLFLRLKYFLILLLMSISVFFEEMCVLSEPLHTKYHYLPGIVISLFVLYQETCTSSWAEWLFITTKGRSHMTVPRWENNLVDVKTGRPLLLTTA